MTKNAFIANIKLVLLLVILIQIVHFSNVFENGPTFSAVNLKNFKELIIRNYYMKHSNGGIINADFRSIKFNLPNGQSIYFDEFKNNQSINYGACNPDKSVCIIFPEYRYIDQKYCLEADLSDNWGATGFVIHYKENQDCIEYVNPGDYKISCASV